MNAYKKSCVCCCLEAQIRLGILRGFEEPSIAFPPQRSLTALTESDVNQPVGAMLSEMSLKHPELTNAIERKSTVEHLSTSSVATDDYDDCPCQNTPCCSGPSSSLWVTRTRATRRRRVSIRRGPWKPPSCPASQRCPQIQINIA